MIRNVIRVALRNLFKDKLLAIVNVSSLTIGIASCILVFLFVQSELSFDSFEKNAGHIYRVANELTTASGLQKTATTSASVATALRSEYPGLRVERIMSADQPVLLGIGEKKLYEPNVLYAEDGFLQMFSFPLLYGDRSTALRAPNSVILTESMALKYFGNTDAVGETIVLDNKQPLRVTGILKGFPDNSTISADFVISYLTMSQEQRAELEDWGYISSIYTFVDIPNRNLATALENNFTAMITKYAGEARAKRTGLFLQPLPGIHLHSDLDDEMKQPGSMSYIWTFSIIGFLTLLISCINFINLSTARSARRAREVGVRKVLGASKQKLALQFLGEAFLTTAIALGAGSVVAEIILPVLNSLTEKHLSFGLFDNPALIIYLLTIFLFVGFVTGSYPALFISSFEPGHILRGSFKLNSARSHLRSVLVSLQFVVTIFLITATIIVLKQLSYIHGRNLGFDKENMLVIPLEDDDAPGQRLAFENGVKKLSGVVDASGISSSLNSIYDNYTFRLQGAPAGESYHFATIFVDHDGLSTLGLKLEEGRWFDKSIASDSTSSFVVNEAAISRFGWKDGLGKQLSGAGIEHGTVIGVVKNFNFSSLHDNIQPLVIRLSEEGLDYFLIRIKSGSGSDAVASVNAMWNSIYPDCPFRYTFLSDDLDQMYGNDVRFQRAVLSFSIIAILITCAGLLGLISYLLEQRRKEIAVRRVVGASVYEIMLLLSREFARWIFVANVIAWPLTYYVMNSWLNDFAYRIEMSIWMFLTSGTVALVIAILTISSHAIKAATANPVESLRYE